MLWPGNFSSPVQISPPAFLQITKVYFKVIALLPSSSPIICHFSLLFIFLPSLPPDTTFLLLLPLLLLDHHKASFQRIFFFTPPKKPQSLSALPFSEPLLSLSFSEGFPLSTSTFFLTPFLPTSSNLYFFFLSPTQLLFPPETVPGVLKKEAEDFPQGFNLGLFTERHHMNTHQAAKLGFIMA